MLNDQDLIKNRVSDVLKKHKILNKKNINKYTESCFNTYTLSMEKGLSKDEALDISIESLDKSLSSKKLIRPSIYSTILSTNSFLFALIIMLIGCTTIDSIFIMGPLYPIYLLMTLGFLIYALVTYKRRNMFDFILASLLFLSTIIINIQTLDNIYRPNLGWKDYSLSYRFPGILYNNTHIYEGPLYDTERIETAILFDPTLIISFICLITNFVLIILAKIKKPRKEENNISNDYQLIKDKVSITFENHHKYLDSDIDKCIKSCSNIYTLSIEKGLNKEEALDISIQSLDRSLSSKELNESNTYSTILSVNTFIFCFIATIISRFGDTHSLYRGIVPIYLAITTILLIYTLSTYKRRDIIDFIIVILLLASAITINAQCLKYIYLQKTGDYYYWLDYDLPGLLRFEKNILIDGKTTEQIYSITMFDPTFIVSLICLITNFTYRSINKRKRNKEKNS